MAITLPYILTSTLLTITIKGRPHMLPHTDPRYNEILALIKAPTNSDAEVERLLDRIGQVKAFVKDSKLEVRGSDVFFGDERVTGELANRIMWHIEQGVGVEALSNFVEKLYQNPSHRVVTHMYPFMEYGKLPITPDGDFLAYKRVNKRGDDFVDCHSGKIVNNVGSIVTMNRRDVNDNPEETCSYGLHACSHEYLKSFGRSHVVTVKINPADVVAIPVDYNNTKLRCCRYEVVEVLSDDQIKDKALSAAPVMSRVNPKNDQNNNGIDDREEFANPDNVELEGVVQHRWEVHVGTYDGGGTIASTWQLHKNVESFKSRESARDAARNEVDDIGQVADNLRDKLDHEDSDRFVTVRVYDTKNRTYI